MKKYLTFWNIFPPSLIIVGVLLLIGRILIKTGQPENAEIIESDETTADDIPDEPEITREASIVNHYKIIRDTLPESVPDITAKIITAQSMHETGVFTNKYYSEQNNLFSMRHPIIRETLSTGDRDGFANFATLEDSVNDLLLYFKEFDLKPNWKEPAAYVKAIKSKGYFEDTYIDYYNGVRRHLAKVKTLVQ